MWIRSKVAHVTPTARDAFAPHSSRRVKRDKHGRSANPRASHFLNSHHWEKRPNQSSKNVQCACAGVYPRSYVGASRQWKAEDFITAHTDLTCIGSRRLDWSRPCTFLHHMRTASHWKSPTDSSFRCHTCEHRIGGLSESIPQGLTFRQRCSWFLPQQTEQGALFSQLERTVQFLKTFS